MFKIGFWDIPGLLNDHTGHLKPAFQGLRWAICLLPSLSAPLKDIQIILLKGTQTASILINFWLWYYIIYGFVTARLVCFNTTSEGAQGSPVLSKFRYLRVGNKPENYWMRHSLVYLLRCEEHGCEEELLLVQGHEHPGEVPNLSLCGHDRRLHRPCGHLLHWKSWCFNSCRRWELYSVSIPMCISSTLHKNTLFYLMVICLQFLSDKSHTNMCKCFLISGGFHPGTPCSQ